MCGRYSLFAEEDIAELNRIIREVEAHGGTVKTGEIYPTNQAPVLLVPKEGSGLEPAVLSWGFPGFKGSRVLINARAETAEEKKTFRDSLLDRRCVIPSTGFYEWTQDGQKQKYRFNLPDSPMLYMAGFYKAFQGEQRFIILTTAANPSVADVHNRMPVILRPEEQEEWVRDLSGAMELLHRTPPLLIKTAV